MKYLIIPLVTALFFALTFSSAPKEFSILDLVFILSLMVIVVTVELIITRLVGRYRVAQHLLLALFSTGNIVSVNLVLNEAFVSLSFSMTIMALLVGLFILYTLSKIFDEYAYAAKLLSLAMSLAFAGVLLQTLLSSSNSSTIKISRSNGKTSAENIRLVDFKSKPNVYFISFDSLWPKALLKKYLDIEAAPYHTVLDAKFRRFKNFFADNVKTTESLNSLLALDRHHYAKAKSTNRHSKFFQGVIPSPLFEIFKHNSYETNTLYHTNFFGQGEGPHIDNNFVKDDHFGACEFVAPRHKKYTFFGLCSLVDNESFLSFFRLLNNEGKPIQDPVDFLIESMDKVVKKDAPQVLVAYIYSPGHTEKSFDYAISEKVKNYREKYIENSKKTESYLTDIVNFIDERDPSAILYLFGDHGPFLSKKTEFKQDPTFVVQDRFGIYGGIYPQNRCTESFSRPYTTEFMTILQGTHMIIRCLSGGQDVFVEPDKYTITQFVTKEKNRYEDYLYE